MASDVESTVNLSFNHLFAFYFFLKKKKGGRLAKVDKNAAAKQHYHLFKLPLHLCPKHHKFAS